MTYKVSQAVILAGGQGMRLRPFTLTTPKPMLKIHGEPFLEYIIKLLKKNDIRKVLILTGYLHKKIENYFKDGRNFGLSISYSFSPVKDDTGARLRKAKKLIDDVFLLLYADNYWPCQLQELVSFYQKMQLPGMITVFSNHDNSTKNNIFVNSVGLVERYDRTRTQKELNGVDIGFFILKRYILNMLPHKNCSFEDVVIPDLIKKKQLAGFLTHHKYYGLSNLQRIPIIEKHFIKKRVVFLDRDGVINKKAPKGQYITKWEEFEFLPGTVNALKILKKKGYVLYIVTNQAGIARGMMTEKQLEELHGMLVYALHKEGVTIDDVFVCSHGWDEGCFCRKPSPGLFFKAAADNHINLYETFCIGDDERDIIAGRAAGCKTFQVSKEQSLFDIASKYL